MLDRCITLLTPAIERNSNPIVIDATLGLGGHSKAILERFPQVKIVGLDRDQSAMKIAKENLQDFAERITIIPRFMTSYLQFLILLALRR
jgi:16S rRNA (cytosine1402-N4)-methyltransferase